MRGIDPLFAPCHIVRYKGGYGGGGPHHIKGRGYQISKKGVYHPPFKLTYVNL